MIYRALPFALAAALLGTSLTPLQVRAENQMGYSLLTPQEAAGLPRNHGGLGLVVDRSQELTDSGMTFDIIRVKQVRPGSPGARAGLKPNDNIIAIDGRVFPTLATFAAYVGSLAPGAQAAVDYIPAGGGPAQAQRVAVTIASLPGQPAPEAKQAGLSTGTKVAIGVGAAALIGCYEMGCFTHKPVQAQQRPMQQTPQQVQQPLQQ
jgi:S1-C subfamily serine protease